MGTIIGNHRVHFIYDNEQLSINHNNTTIDKTRKITTCVITENNESQTEISRDTVKLHHKDQDQNIMARHYAFNKAVNNITDRQLRGELIRNYYDSPIKKPKKREN